MQKQNYFEVEKMEPFPGHEAASKGVHIDATLTTKVKIYCSCTCKLPYDRK